MVWVLAYCCISFIPCYDMTSTAPPTCIALAHRIKNSPLFVLNVFPIVLTQSHQQCITSVQHGVTFTKFCRAQSAFPATLAFSNSNSLGRYYFLFRYCTYPVLRRHVALIYL